MGNNQKFLLNGYPVEIRDIDGGLELTGDQFIEELLRLGFHLGRNNSPEDLQRILHNVPAQYRDAFMAGFNAK